MMLLHLFIPLFSIMNVKFKIFMLPTCHGRELNIVMIHTMKQCRDSERERERERKREKKT